MSCIIDVIETLADMSEQGTSQDQPLDIGSDAENSHLNSSILRRVQPEDKFTIAGQDYVKASVLRDTKRGKTTSWIWNHGIEIVNLETEKRFWKCTLCKKSTLYNRSSTDHPMNHLERVHRLNKDGSIKPTGRIDAALQKTSTVSTLLMKTDQDAFQKALLDWIVDMHIPFSIVENAKF